MPSKFHQTPSMKNLWNQSDLDRLAWKALDLIVDAAMSLQIVKDFLAIEVFEEKPTPRSPRKKSLAKRR
jgi:hypothetical protein